MQWGIFTKISLQPSFPSTQSSGRFWNKCKGGCHEHIRISGVWIKNANYWEHRNKYIYKILLIKIWLCTCPYDVQRTILIYLISRTELDNQLHPVAYFSCHTAMFKQQCRLMNYHVLLITGPAALYLLWSFQNKVHWSQRLTSQKAS